MVKRAVTLAVAAGGMMLISVPAQALVALSPTAGPSAAALADIPPDYLTLYTGAARTCPGLPWQVLAAIGSIESDHGRSDAPDVHGPTGYGGAEGPMQFEPATFAAYAVQADRDHPLSPYDPADAVYSAARMLCAAGASGGSQAGLSQAIYAYNHAGWYVTEVLNLAARYSGSVTTPTPAPRPAPTAASLARSKPAREAAANASHVPATATKPPRPAGNAPLTRAGHPAVSRRPPQEVEQRGELPLRGS